MLNIFFRNTGGVDYDSSMALLSLGNPQLDQILGGGVEEKTCVLLAGEPGSGKTTLSLQFVTHPHASMLQSAYFCIDKIPECIMDQAIRLNHTVMQQVDSGAIKFVDISLQGWVLGQSVEDLLRVIEYQMSLFIEQFNPQRIIIDSLMPNILQGESLHNRQQFVREFLQIIRHYDATILGILYDIDASHSGWLDVGLVSNQLTFYRKSDLDYVTYWLELNSNNKQNMSGRYRFTFDSRGIHVKHRLC